MEIRREMKNAEDCGLAYTGLTLTQLKIAAKGWKRAAKKRASDLTLNLDDFPLYVDPQYIPPSAARRACQYKATATPWKAGKYWSAFHQQYLKDKTCDKGKYGK